MSAVATRLRAADAQSAAGLRPEPRARAWRGWAWSCCCRWPRSSCASAGLGGEGWMRALDDPRVQASLMLSFSASAIAAVIASLAGALVAWVIVRYRFPGRRLLDALVDLPFALPTAVAGIALTAIYSANGWVGRFARTARLEDRLRTGRHRDRAGVHRPAVRGAHPATGARNPRPRPGRSRGLARCEPLHHVPPRRVARTRCRRCSPASRSPSRARWANTVR